MFLSRFHGEVLTLSDTLADFYFFMDTLGAVIIVTICMSFVLISLVAITSRHLKSFYRSQVARFAFFRSREGVTHAWVCIELVLGL